MNDFDKATNKIGNRFEMVLVASERMRELHSARKEMEEQGLLSLSQRRKEIPPCEQSILDIEEGKVGREYLSKIKSRNNQRKKYKLPEL